MSETEAAAAEVVAEVEVDEGDTFPGLILGLNAMFGTLWWILGWFVYIKNRAYDDNLKSKAGAETSPVGFFWERITDTEGIYVYMSLSLFFGFWVYIIISVVELVAWIFYLGGSTTFFTWWVTFIGYYGSIVLLMLPWMMDALHIALTLKGKVTASPGAYVVFRFLGNMLLWISHSLIHVAYTPRLQAYSIIKDGAMFEESAERCPLRRGRMTDEQYKIAC